MRIQLTFAHVGIALLTTSLLLPSLGARRKGDDAAAMTGEKVTDRGRIDWNKGDLVATGLGAIPNDEPNQAKAYLRARGFAKLDALRNLLMVIDHVRIDSQTTGSDYEAKSDEILAEVKGIVRGARIVGERKITMGNGSMIEVTVSTPMYGDQGIAGAFLPEVTRRNKEADDTSGVAPDPAPLPPVKLIGPNRSNFHDPDTHYGVTHPGERVTSVIIDTRGIGVGRCMSPKIRRSDGSEVWGSVEVDPDYVIEHGIVVYAHSIQEARHSDRAGENPLVLRATGGAGGRFLDDAVLSDEDSDALLQFNKSDGFMDKFHVIFVVDPKL